MRITRALLLACTLSLAACREPTDGGGAATRPLANVVDGQAVGPEVQRQLAALRQLTVAFHDTAAATHAGWTAKITGCMFLQNGGGAMGFHYANPDYLDGVVRADQPELLIYEPEKNGTRRLVGVEYVIFYTEHPRDAAPPMLFGQAFGRNDTFGLWGLHAWVWKENPTGMFKDWNPAVSCAATTDLMPM